MRLELQLQGRRSEGGSSAGWVGWLVGWGVRRHFRGTGARDMRVRETEVERSGHAEEGLKEDDGVVDIGE